MANIDDTFNRPPPPKVKATREDILGALKFGEQVERETKFGPRLVSKARATPEFFDLYATDRDTLRAEGYTLGEWPENSGIWEVTRWVRVDQAVIVRRQQAKELSRATHAEINVPCPPGVEFFGFQKAGIAFGYDRPNILLADEPGLGKTCQAIGILNCIPDVRRKLVICPASLKENWRREITRWQARREPIYVADSSMLPDMLGWVIVNYDVLHRHEDVLHRLEFDALICDEVHYCKNKDARRSKMVFGIKPTEKQQREGIPEVPGIRAKRKILITGTPICNRPAELFPIINYLDPITWSNFFAFGIRYCGGYKDGKHWNFKGDSNLFELQEKLRSTLMVRRLKKDVMKDLPPKLRRVVEFAPTGEALVAVKAEREQYPTEESYQQHVRQLMEYKGSFNARSTFRKNCAVAKAKMPAVIEYLDDAVMESGKVIIFVWHVEVAAILMAHFGRQAVRVMGEDDLPTRQQAVDSFQTDPRINVFVGGIKPAGVGLTLHASSRVIFMELDDVPGNVTQAEDRAHRIGQQDNVLVEHLIVTGTLDAVMARTCVEKQDTIDRALDRQKEGIQAPKVNGVVKIDVPAVVDQQPRAPVGQLELL